MNAFITHRRMNESTLNQLITGGFSLITAAAGWVGKVCWDLYRVRKDNTISKVINGIKSVYTCLSTLRRDTGAVRVVVVKVHNGGGKPKLTANLYASSLYADWGSGMRDGYDWTNQRLDPTFIDTLNSMLMAPEAWLDVTTEALPEGQLRDLLTTDGASHALFCNLAQTDHHLIALQLSFRPGTDMDAVVRTAIRAAVNDLRDIFKTEPVH